MSVRADLVGGLNFLVDFLLLLGTNRLCGYPADWKRSVPAAGLGGIYAAACLISGFHFLGNLLWRAVSLFMMSWIAFGSTISAVRRGFVFALLNMALGSTAVGIGEGNVWSLVGAAALICLMCIFGFRGSVGGTCYVPVELIHGNERICLTALCDTGNTLRDPVTGGSVLVVEASIAKKLIGLTDHQLRNPVEGITQIKLPGLRLIPYRTVGNSCGMLLALRMQNVKIGSSKGSSLVAFAPNGLSSDGSYQALTGGLV